MEDASLVNLPHRHVKTQCLELHSCYHKTLGFVTQGRLMGYTQFRTESLKG